MQVHRRACALPLSREFVEGASDQTLAGGPDVPVFSKCPAECTGRIVDSDGVGLSALMRGDSGRSRGGPVPSLDSKVDGNWSEQGRLGWTSLVKGSRNSSILIRYDTMAGGKSVETWGETIDKGHWP